MIQFDFEILWMSSQLIIQWNYIIYFLIRSSFFKTFYTSFCKRVHNSKEIVKFQGLFVLTVVYVDMKAYPLTKCYYIRLFYIAFLPSYLRYNKDPDLNLAPQSTICSYAPVYRRKRRCPIMLLNPVEPHMVPNLSKSFP